MRFSRTFSCLRLHIENFSFNTFFIISNYFASTDFTCSFNFFVIFLVLAKDLLFLPVILFVGLLLFATSNELLVCHSHLQVHLGLIIVVTEIDRIVTRKVLKLVKNEFSEINK